jgi:ferrochelatase
MKGDPYHCECHKTGRLIAAELGLSDNQWRVSFQSRFGPAEWLKPYTAELFEQLPLGGVKRLDVVCPGFISDCLETLEEIAMEGKEEFLTAGGEQYQFIPCLNDSDEAVALLTSLIVQETMGWPVRPESVEAEADRGVARSRALSLGAED